jgi:hypothetical protein
MKIFLILQIHFTEFNKSKKIPPMILVVLQHNVEEILSGPTEIAKDKEIQLLVVLKNSELY